MTDISVGNIIRVGRVLAPEDTVGRAAEALRASGLAELPVVSQDRVLGMVSEARVLGLLSRGEPDAVSAGPVSGVMAPEVVCLNPYMSVGQAAEAMREAGAQVLPVIEPYGGFLGVAVRADVVGALRRAMRPPVVAGMATPLGVYLTTGSHRAGAGDLALMLTGVSMMLMNLLAVYLVAGFAGLIQTLTGVPALVDLASASLLGYLLRVLSVVVFLGLFRVFPLAGYHGAEHMVVHAIESGEPLTPEGASGMPRVHPRCGTNLVTGVILFLLVAQLFSSDVAVLVALFVLIFAWRAIGGVFQYFITTKPPSPRELSSGIRAGESLLARYRENPSLRVSGWRRVWNTGMPQVMIGVLAVLLAQESLGLRIPGLL